MGVVCEICGLPQLSLGICATCSAEKPHFRALRAWTAFDDPIRKALHNLKYRRDISMGDALAAHMLPFVEGLGWEFDLFIPIPLGKQRLKERGYNQVGMIAKPLTMALDAKYVPHGLTRQKETRTQVGLTRQERKENIREAFRAWHGVEGKRVLIFDDVSTTGSTLSSAAESLLKSGAQEVYALTVARALPQHGLRHA